MASDQEITEYERRRLENIKRNGELLASLNIQARLADLSASSKRARKEEKSYKKSSSEKKKKEKLSPDTPVVIRRSLRTRGVAPDTEGLPKDFSETHATSKSKHMKLTSPSERRSAVLGPIGMKDCYDGDGSYRSVVDKFTSSMTKSKVEDGDNDSGKRKTRSSTSSPSKVERKALKEPIDIGSLKLESENIARVVPGRIFSVKFLPSTDMTMVAVGNKSGHLGFWDVKPEKEGDEEVVHLYQPHTAPISGISVHPFSLSKIYTSSYDGLLRVMNIEREQFDLAYSSSSGAGLFSLSQQPSDANSVYLGESQGTLNIIDGRVGEITTSWSLHEGRINSIDFNPANSNIMATSSSDGLACLWDLRKMDPEKTALQSVNHVRAVHSAYFSPSGSSLATTSLDDNIGVLRGVNFEDKLMIPHENWTNRWVSSFRAVWGWDDAYLFVGNMKRRVDVLSVNQKKTVFALQSQYMSAIPCRYDAHPFSVGMLAGATSGGQVYIWTASL